MENRRKLLEFIEGLLSNNGLKLRRGFGIGLYLYNQLKDNAPPYVLENLQLFDRMPFEKRKLSSLTERFLESSETEPKRTKGGQRELKDFLLPWTSLSFREQE
ncbi:hypothetical protein [Hydrogenivirga sp. 128-5-R1-1]|uniref:hypothetical protein n=1 Tax=Hydrogenivirga sp. 128-5-R1-1 TaxID=392423 RepID=UPI00015F1728|nr:hypothetical protein [Hydrogenivirga sp. 128-5-R1-1]EDP76133.1 ATP-dependent DNA helicase RecG [Hydrogenivirga sp. 128-5-R1-1]